jgi:hypothetical protein
MPADGTRESAPTGTGVPWAAASRSSHPAGSPDEHIAILCPARECDILCRKDDLLDEGVAVVFSVRGGEAVPLALCFRAGRFTPAEADDWLRQWGFEVLLLAEAGAVLTSPAAASPPMSARCGPSTGRGTACL